MNDFVSHFTFYSSSRISAIKQWKLISLIAWKIKLKTSNWQLIFVLVTFSFHILICIFILHPILLYSGDPENSSNSQTSFLRGRWLGCGQGLPPRVGGNWKSGWSSAGMGWAADGMGLRGYTSSQSFGHVGACADFAVCGLLCTKTFEKFSAHFNVLNAATLVEQYQEFLLRNVIYL